MWHFIADTHLGHGNIVKYCKRPFLTREEEGLLDLADRGVIPAKELRISKQSIDLMDNTILDSINSTVSANDTLVINGDFCWAARDTRFQTIRAYRDRIRCKNVFLILGNHDDKPTIESMNLFTKVYDQYSFNINGQKVIACHYPERSWESAHHGSWMVYGHVHNLFYPEDNGELMPYEKEVYTSGFAKILENLGIENNSGERDTAIRELLDVVASTYGVDLTVDVGVDNVRPGIPFGTPWSMDDLHAYFAKKKPRWDARNDAFRKLRPASSLKGGDPNADPKF